MVSFKCSLGLWPLSKERRISLLEELGAMSGLWGDPWCIRGNFNVICLSSERNREGGLNRSMRRFS